VAAPGGAWECSSSTHSSRDTFPRKFFVLLRRCFPSSRFLLDAAEGLVGRRGVGGIRALLISRLNRSKQSVRLLIWRRKRSDWIIKTPWLVMRRPARRTHLFLTAAVNTGNFSNQRIADSRYWLYWRSDRRGPGIEHKMLEGIDHRLQYFHLFATSKSLKPVSTDSTKGIFLNLSEISPVNSDVNVYLQTI